MKYFVTLSIVYYKNTKSKFQIFDFNNATETSFEHRINALKKCFSLRSEHQYHTDDDVEKIDLAVCFTYEKVERLIFQNTLTFPYKSVTSKNNKQIIYNNLVTEIDIYNRKKWDYQGTCLNKDSIPILSTNEEIINNLFSSIDS